jgi:predicted lipoprotein with Yx(FWY)xxD motif
MVTDTQMAQEQGDGTMSLRIVLAAGVLVFGLAGVAAAADMVDVVTVHDSGIGKVLVDKKGMTLYTFDKDPAGKSVCNGKCAENWPPLLATSQAQASGDFSLITRDDGKKQWAYKGKPLYLWVKDAKPGDTSGDKVNNVWAAARP